MQFQVPQFIERETKVVGPFTFRQFIFVGIAGAILFILYFMVPFWLFLLASIILGGGALALSFVRVGGQDLPTVIKNFFGYFISPKVYLWRKKAISPKLIKAKPKPKEKPEEETPTLKVTERGHLQKLSTQVETRVK